MDQGVAWGDAKLERVYAHFERNLKEIIDVVSRHQVPLLVSTVAVNLEDSPPFLSLPESEAQKRFDEGAYAKARDLDALRLRADSRINGIIEKVSKADHEGEVICRQCGGAICCCDSRRDSWRNDCSGNMST